MMMVVGQVGSEITSPLAQQRILHNLPTGRTEYELARESVTGIVGFFQVSTRGRGEAGVERRDDTGQMDDLDHAEKGEANTRALRGCNWPKMLLASVERRLCRGERITSCVDG